MYWAFIIFPDTCRLLFAVWLCNLCQTSIPLLYQNKGKPFVLRDQRRTLRLNYQSLLSALDSETTELVRGAAHHRSPVHTERSRSWLCLIRLINATTRSAIRPEIGVPCIISAFFPQSAMKQTFLREIYANS